MHLISRCHRKLIPIWVECQNLNRRRNVPKSRVVIAFEPVKSHASVRGTGDEQTRSTEREGPDLIQVDFNLLRAPPRS